MKTTINTALFLVAGISVVMSTGCQNTRATKPAAEMAALKQPLYAEPGATRTFRESVDGSEMTLTQHITADGKHRIMKRDDGCVVELSFVDDFAAPADRWEKCRPGPWGSGYTSNIRKEGQIWPFKVGNKVSYHWEATNSRGKTNPKAWRKCEVEGTETVKAGGKDYDTYKIACTEHAGKRTWYFSPEAHAAVLSVREHKKGWSIKRELIAEL